MSFKTIQVINQVERRFKSRLARKTNWGRNEILEEYQEAVKEVIDQQSDDQSIEILTE